MSESMVERVARMIAVTQVCGLDFSDGQRALCFDPRSVHPRQRENCECLQAARAAIEAMREPTDDQRNEYFRIRKLVGDTDSAATFVDDRWECAIDAALSEAKS